MVTQKYHIGEYIVVKCGVDKERLGRIESYADGLYRIQTEEGSISALEEDIASTDKELGKRMKWNEFVRKIKSYERNIVEFNKDNDFVLQEPTIEGYYLTIRVGLGGIYTNVNYWKEGNWLGRAADGSRVVARSSEPIDIEY